MNSRNPFLFAVYRHALRLYPARLRLQYQDQILQTLRDAHADRTTHPFLFWARLFIDLLLSSVKERLLMTRDSAMHRPVFVYSVTLAVILTLMGGAAAVTMQQLLRRDADQPQIEMADSYAVAIALGHNPADILPAVHIDLRRSLLPFAIFYNENGVPVSSTASLDRSTPTPPSGVFAFVRVHGSEELTWQPQPGLRIATVMRRVDGANPGFLLVGRSLAMVQQQEDALRRGTFITWFVVMALIALGALFLNRAQLRPATAV